jgi:hypothetical protein
VAAGASGLGGRREGTDEPEIADFGFAVGSNEDVGGFEVAVQEVARVEVVDGGGNLGEDVLLLDIAEVLVPG